MYRLNGIDLWNQHHHELLREAAGQRFANQLRAARPKRDRRIRNGGQVSTLRRASALWSRTSVPFFRV